MQTCTRQEFKHHLPSTAQLNSIWSYGQRARHLQLREEVICTLGEVVPRLRKRQHPGFWRWWLSLPWLEDRRRPRWSAATHKSRGRQRTGWRAAGAQDVESSRRYDGGKAAQETGRRRRRWRGLRRPQNPSSDEVKMAAWVLIRRGRKKGKGRHEKGKRKRAEKKKRSAAGADDKKNWRDLCNWEGVPLPRWF